MFYSHRNAYVFSELAKEADLIKEWKLVYSPQNDRLDDLMAIVARNLELDGFIGVANEQEIGTVMTNQKLIAGIQFKLAAVSWTTKLPN